MVGRFIYVVQGRDILEINYPVGPFGTKVNSPSLLLSGIVGFIFSLPCFYLTGAICYRLHYMAFGQLIGFRIQHAFWESREGPWEDGQEWGKPHFVQ